MNINGTPSFTGFKCTAKGKESLINKPIDFIENDLLPTIKKAVADKKNSLSIEDNGRIYIQTPEHGKFTINNPSREEANGRYFSCDVRTFDGDEIKRFTVPFETPQQAKQFANENFGGGSYIPKMNLDLYNAIHAADRYKQALIDSIDLL